MTQRKVFLSYSRDDEAWVERVRKMLKPLIKRNELSLFWDRDIHIGEDWEARLDAEIEDAHAAIVLLTANCVASDFVMEREVPRFLERAIPIYPLYIGSCDVEETALAPFQISNDPKTPLTLLTPGEQEEALLTFTRQIKAALTREVVPPATRQPRPADVRVEIDRLPQGTGTFVGRAKELKQLDDLWADAHVHVASLVAWGGVGKTALTQAWLARMALNQYRGAKRVYAWSFYSQGTENRVASADDFLLKALAWFGEPDPASLSPSARPTRLAERVLAEPTLLILDGLEPLQHGPGPQLGRLKEHGLRAFLRALASAPAADDASATHLCLLTTRVPVADLDDREGASFRRIDLQRLAEVDGVALLSALGVKGHEHDMKAAWKRAKGHALTLKLVGQYAVDVLDGDVGRPEAIELLDPEAPEGQHAAKVLEAYDAWLGDTPERAIVRLMGLFDRPADGECVAALRKVPAIGGLTEVLVDLPESRWKRALTRLRRVGLLLGGADGELDAHPLVRTHAAARLEETMPEAWRAGHLRLYGHLTSSTEHQPDTAEGLLPLYQAVVHGCRAGRVQEACDDVYWKRINRGSEFYSTNKLGLFGSDLTAVTAFFEKPFTRPHGSLTAADQAFLLNQAGFHLRALGRLDESEAPMRVTLEINEENEKWNNAAVVAGNLSELNVTLGALDQALADAERSVELADRSGDAFMRMANHTKLADAHHQRGEVAAALALFEEAEAMQAEWQPSYPRLYSVQGYRYCDLLLADGDASSARAVIERAEYMLDCATKNNMSLLSKSTARLSRARAWTILAHRNDDDSPDPDASRQARTHLDHAVEGLHAAGYDWALPFSLLARAIFSRLIDRNVTAAKRDLQDVEDLATRCGMRLFACDAHLERARLLRDLSTAADAREQARPHVDAAKKLIAETGYHRRDRELANLERWLSGEAIPKEVLGAWG